jgi:CheY-like chemotaxis protein
MPSGGRIVVETADVVLDQEFVRGHPGATAGRHVRLTVSDSGSGMAADVLARAFEPFFTTKEQGKGTGLGLAIVYGVVKQSGGFVDIESGPERGTTVAVYLPRVAAAVELAVRHEPARPARGGNETVLLVEDEENVRLVARRVLEERGYTVLCASHGREALGVAAAQPAAIDLLVTDVVMPEMGGRDLAARLTSLRPDLPVLFTSGYAADELGDHGVIGHDVAFVQKPFTPDALARAVREALDAHRRATS